MSDQSGDLNARENAKRQPADGPTGGGALLDSFTAPATVKSEKTKGRPKPTQDDIETAARKVEEFWKPRNDRFQRHQDLFELREKAPKKGEMAVYLPDARIYVEKGTGMLGRRNYRIEVPARGEENLRLAQRIENTIRWWDDYVAQAWSDALRPPMSMVRAQSLVLRGWIAERLMLDPDDEMFVSDMLFDPYCIYPALSGTRIKWLCHIYQANLEDVLDDFPKAARALKVGDADRMVKVISYYENSPPYWHAVIADGEWAKKPAELGYWPWRLGVARSNLSPFPIGMSHDSDQPAWVGCGMLDIIEGMLSNQNKFVTMLANATNKQENPPSIMYTQNGVPKELKLDAGVSSVFVGGGQENVQLLDVGPKIANLMPLLSTFQDRISKGTFPTAMFGEGGEPTGYARALMMAAAQDTMESYILALQAINAGRCTSFLDIYSQFGNKPIKYVAQRIGAQQDETKPVNELGRRMWGEELSPEDVLKNGTYVECVYEAISPQDKIALAQTATMLVEKKLISMRTAREGWLGIDDPDLEDDRVLAELTNMNEQAVMVKTRRALKRQGLGDELSALDEASKPQPPPQMQQPMAPAGPPPGGLPAPINLAPPVPEQLPLLPQGPGAEMGIPPGLSASILPPEQAGMTEQTPNDQEIMAMLLAGMKPPGGM